MFFFHEVTRSLTRIRVSSCPFVDSQNAAGARAQHILSRELEGSLPGRSDPRLRKSAQGIRPAKRLENFGDFESRVRLGDFRSVSARLTEPRRRYELAARATDDCI